MGVIPPPRGRSETEHYKIKVEVLAEGLDRPWGIEFLDERTALFSELGGQLRLMIDGKVLPAPITGLTEPPSAVSKLWNQIGFLDVPVPT